MKTLNLNIIRRAAVIITIAAAAFMFICVGKYIVEKTKSGQINWNAR